MSRSKYNTAHDLTGAELQALTDTGISPFAELKLV